MNGENRDHDRSVRQFIFRSNEENTPHPFEVQPAIRLDILIDPQEIAEIFIASNHNQAKYVALETSAILASPFQDLRSSLQTLPTIEQKKPAQLSAHTLVRLNTSQLNKRDDLGFYSPQRIAVLKKMLEKKGLSLGQVYKNAPNQEYRVNSRNGLTNVISFGSPNKKTENDIKNLVRQLSQRKFHPNQSFQPQAPQPLQEIEFMTTFRNDYEPSQREILLGIEEHTKLLRDILTTMSREFAGKNRIPIGYFRPDLR